MNTWALDQYLKMLQETGGGFGGAGAGLGASGMDSNKAWLPYLMKAIFGKVSGEQNAIDKWLRDQTMGATAGLGKSLGWNLSRTGVPVASGTQTLANRYMAPMSDLIGANRPKTWSENMGTSVGMMELLGPFWEEYMKSSPATLGVGTKNWMPDINAFMKLFGGGRNRFGGGL